MGSVIRFPGASRVLLMWCVLAVLRPVLQAEFNHPGMWASQNELETIRYRVENDIEPQKAAFDKLRSEWTSALSWTPTWVSYVDVGAYNNPKINYDVVVDNSRAAWAQAILWYMTGDDRYAENVLDILDAHARSFNSIQGHNARLFAGWVGKNWYKAMDILKSNYAGWDPAIEARFNEMFNRVYYPLCSDIRPDGANWDFYCMETLMAAAIFQEREDWFNKCLGIWQTLLPGYIAPYGESAETCRDLGHAWMGLAAAVRIAEMAWKQGLDLYDDYNNLLLTGLEFHARYTLSNGGTCVECGHYDGFGSDQFTQINGTVIMLNMANINERAMSWEIAYNHYHNRRNFEMPNSYAVMMGVRSQGILRWGDGPGTLFFANMGFGTLMVKVRQPSDGLWLKPGGSVDFEVDVESVVSAAEGVEFYFGEQFLGSSTTAPFQFTWTDIPEGLHEVTMVAYDNEGNEGVAVVGLVVQDSPPGIDVSGTSTQDPVLYHPHLVMDGDLGSYWSAEGLGQQLVFDLNCVRTLTGMEMAFTRGQYVDYDFTVEVSINGFNWNTVLDGNSGLTGTDPQPFDLPDRPARYVRITGYGNQSNLWNRYSEVAFQFADGLPAEANNLAPLADAGPDLSRTLPDDSILIQGVGHDIDGAIASYQWEQLSGPSCDLADPAQSGLDITSLLAGTYVFQLTVTDDEGGKGVDEVMLQVYPESDDGEVVYAINCGGPAETLQSGLPLSADAYFTGGNPLSKTNPIQGTEDPDIYRRYRNGIFSYSFPVDDGTYSVLLKTMESYWTGIGERLFSLQIEDVPVIENIDLVELLGTKFIAYDRSFITEVTDGSLDMDFTASVDNAIACAIIVRKVASGNQPVRLEVVGVDADGALTLRCPTEPGRVYKLYHSGDLTEDSWQLLESRAGTGQPVEFTTPALDGAGRFYRVVRE